MKLIPRAKARSTQARAASASTPTPKVSQEPKEISETSRSLAPSLRYFIGRSSLGFRLLVRRAARKARSAQGEAAGIQTGADRGGGLRSRLAGGVQALVTNGTRGVQMSP